MDRMLTSAFLNKLNSTCKDLIKFKLKYVDLSVIKVNDLKENLKELHLLRCEIPIDWFIKNNLSSIETLDLSQSSRVCAQHLKDLVDNCKNNLKTLSLSFCYRIDDKAVEIISKEFINLTVLKLNGTIITDLALHWICTRLKKLQLLDIRKCKYLLEPDTNFIKESFENNKDFKFNI